MSHIALLYGGKSGEHNISRISAAAVYNSMPARFTVLLIGIDTDGAWYLQDAPGTRLEALDIQTTAERRVSMTPSGGLYDARGNRLHIDAALPVLHGSFGEDGRVQGLLEIAGIPYAGSGVLGSAIGMDKDIAKRLLRDAGLPVVPWRTLRLSSAEDIAATSARAGGLFSELGRPLFVKPANAGSSVGVSRVETEDQLTNALELAVRFDRKILVEQAIAGREIECSVTGRMRPRSFPPGEIVPAGSHTFYDYQAKYTDPDGALLKVPAGLPEETAGQIRALAEQAYICVEASGFSRVDFLLENATGKLYINEINTIPGMTPISLFPRMAKAGGMDMPSLIETFIDDALAEHAWRSGLSYAP